MIFKPFTGHFKTCNYTKTSKLQKWKLFLKKIIADTSLLKHLTILCELSVVMILISFSLTDKRFFSFALQIMLYPKVIYFYSLSVGSQGYLLSSCFLLYSQVQDLTVLKYTTGNLSFYRKNSDLHGVQGAGVFSFVLELSIFLLSTKNWKAMMARSSD